MKRRLIILPVMILPILAAIVLAGFALVGSPTVATQAGQPVDQVEGRHSSAVLHSCYIQEDGTPNIHMDIEAESGYDVGYTVTDDCKLELISERWEEKVSPFAVEESNDLLLNCRATSYQGRYEELVGDLTPKTQFWAHGNFCYDGSAVTWWMYPPDVYPGAISPWSHTNTGTSDGWLTNPTVSQVWVTGYFARTGHSHWIQARSYQHSNGAHTCGGTASGSFPTRSPGPSGVFIWCNP